MRLSSRVTTSLQALLAVSLAITPAAAANGSYFFRPKAGVFSVQDNGATPEDRPVITSMPSIPVLKAGSPMAGVLPTVANGTDGDVYSLNKPLPDGLDLDPATGRISGTPAEGSHGIHSGYVLSVENAEGRGSSSGQFSFRIRHHEDPTISFDGPFEFQPGVPFTTPGVTVTNGHAFIGSPVYSVSPGAGVSVNSSTGALSGTLSEGRTVTISVADGIGAVASTSLEFVPAIVEAVSASEVLPDAARSLVNSGTMTAGQLQTLYDGGFSTSLTMGSSQVTQITYDFGRPVSFDSYFLKKSDTGTSTYSTVLQIETDQGWLNVHETSYDGQISLSDERIAQRVRLIGGGGATYSLYEFRIGTGGGHTPPTLAAATLALTNEPQSVSLGGAAQDSAYITGNATIHQLSGGALPPGASLSEDGTLSLPAAEEDGTWNFTVTVADALGFSSSRSYTVMTNAVPASTVLPVSASRGTVLQAYDGLTNQDYTWVNENTSLVFEFDRFVSFDKIYMVTSNTFRLEAEIGGVWQTLSVSSISNNMAQLSASVTTKKVKVSGTSYYSVHISEVRIGGGPAHSNPVLVSNVVDAEADEQNVQLAADVSVYSTGEASFEVVDPSDLPPGATLSPSGMLYLPSSEDLPAETWTVAVRITDSLGSMTEASLLIRNAEEEVVLFPNLTVTAGQMAITHPGWIAKNGYDYTGRWTYVQEIFPNLVPGDTVTVRIENPDNAASPYLYVCKNDLQPATTGYVCDGNTSGTTDMFVTPGVNKAAYYGNTIAPRMTAPPAGTSKSLTLIATYQGVTKTFTWTVTGK
mgnify:CR=1 FL=1